jgi:hypothetical protein
LGDFFSNSSGHPAAEIKSALAKNSTPDQGERTFRAKKSPKM